VLQRLVVAALRTTSQSSIVVQAESILIGYSVLSRVGHACEILQHGGESEVSLVRLVHFQTASGFVEITLPFTFFRKSGAAPPLRLDLRHMPCSLAGSTLVVGLDHFRATPHPIPARCAWPRHLQGHRRVWA
jgi:hypothetical protein